MVLLLYRFQREKIQKSCGTDVKSRQTAEDYIRTLPRPSTDGLGSGKAPRNADLTIGEIAKDMFVPGSSHIQRRQQLKKSVSDEALVSNRRFVKHIMTAWGQRSLRTLEFWMKS